jgi:vacuolar-type H+-ATPase subunit E/Vma4
MCRKEDKSILAESEVSIISTMQTIGGFVAQSKDDNKELDLTFEELLRIHDDEIESLITEVLR